MDEQTVSVVGDNDGIAIFGEPVAVERFLGMQGLVSKDLNLKKLSKALNAGSATAQVSSELMTSSGRWVKLTKESAKAFRAEGLMKGSAEGISRAVTMKDGKISGILEIATGAGVSFLGPAALPIVAGLMAQQSMQQSFDEILDYLAVIDEKVDDILRAQKDQVLSELAAVGMLIDDAMVLREHVGRVSAVTWSKVQTNSMSIAQTQDRALRELDALANQLDKKSKMGDLAKAVSGVEAKATEWITILARSFQLDDAMSILELDRVLDSEPEALDDHRTGLQDARTKRLQQITQSTGRLLERLQDRGVFANSKVLLHPKTSAQVVRSTSKVSGAIHEFRALLGIGSEAELLSAKKWSSAVGEVRDKVVGVGADGIGAVRQFGEETKGRAMDKAESVADSIAHNIRSRRDGKTDSASEIEK